MSEETQIIYKPGDKVQIVSERAPYMNSEGEMDKYLGQTMTIKARTGFSGGYRMVEDNGHWFWHPEMFEKNHLSNLTRGGQNLSNH